MTSASCVDRQACCGSLMYQQFYLSSVKLLNCPGLETVASTGIVSTDQTEKYVQLLTLL